MPSPLDSECCGKPPTSKPATGSGMFNGMNSTQTLTDEQKRKIRIAKLKRLGRRR